MTSRQVHSPSLLLENTGVARGNRLVLDDFSLSAEAGDIVWIRGANGVGKSTLLRLIAGLLPLASGKRTVDGTIALADENLALDMNLPVKQALRFWARLDGATADQCDAAMTAMALSPLVRIPCRFLSNGQRKRANLARMLAANASIWLLDEPYNGLDSASAVRLDEALLRHSAAGGMALVAAHQPPPINVAQSILLDSRTMAA